MSTPLLVSMVCSVILGIIAIIYDYNSYYKRYNKKHKRKVS